MQPRLPVLGRRRELGQALHHRLCRRRSTSGPLREVAPPAVRVGTGRSTRLRAGELAPAVGRAGGGGASHSRFVFRSAAERDTTSGAARRRQPRARASATARTAGGLTQRTLVDGGDGVVVQSLTQLSTTAARNWRDGAPPAVVDSRQPGPRSRPAKDGDGVDQAEQEARGRVAGGSDLRALAGGAGQAR